MDYGSSTKSAQDEIDLIEVIRVVWSHKYLVVGMTTVFTALAVIYALSVTPVYRAQAVITQVDLNGNAGSTSTLFGELGGLAQLAGINLGGITGNAQPNGRILIESRTFGEEFIKRYDLMPVIFPDEWDEATQDWHEDLQRKPTVWQGAYVLQDIFELNLDAETGLLTLTVEWTDPERAAKFANDMVALANEIARERDMARAERSIEYLNEQIESTNVIELQRVLYNLLENEQKTLMLANARQEYVFRVVDPALEPLRRAKPNRRLIVILGMVIGLSVGLFLVAVSRFARKIRQRA